MRRVLLAIAAVCLGLHWQQAWERCRLAQLRSQSARQEQVALENSLKDWPQLRRQAERLAPKTIEPDQIQHQASVQVAVTRLGQEQVYRMRLSGPRASLVLELLDLTNRFCLRVVDLQCDANGQARGEVLLQAVP